MCKKIFINPNVQIVKTATKSYSPEILKCSVHREEPLLRDYYLDDLSRKNSINYSTLRDFVINWLVTENVPIWLSKDILGRLEFDIEHLGFSNCPVAEK